MSFSIPVSFTSTECILNPQSRALVIIYILSACFQFFPLWKRTQGKGQNGMNNEIRENQGLTDFVIQEMHAHGGKREFVVK